MKKNKNNKKKILAVTGGAGFLGCHLCNELSKKYDKIYVIDIEPIKKNEYPKNIIAFRQDIRDHKNLVKIFSKVDEVIHAAAALPLWKKKDIFSTNVKGTKSVLDAAIKNNIKKVVFISSTSVYGIPKKHPIYETDPVVGVGPYGESKIRAEKLCIDYRKKGIVKLPWRVDWPMRWKYENVDFEPGGIDHSVHGGSFTTSKEIVKDIFNGEIPIYQFYDWVKIKGGKEFSSSTGNVTNVYDVEEVYEPEILRYLFVGTKPKTGFQISFDNDVIKIYEDYDSLEKKYYNKKADNREKRIYELSRLKISKKKPEKISFRHLVSLVQIGKLDGLNKESKIRAEKVKNWLDKYAGEDMKFKVQDKINVKLNEKEKQALIKLKEVLKKKKHTEESLFNEFYKICKTLNIKNTEFFDAAYRVIINKKKGPRLAALILNVGKDKIIKLLDKIK